jgi:tetratricopeptide (TPR) repeat protein
MVKPQRAPGSKDPDDSLPLYDGSYYLIITHAVQALRNGTGVANKVKGFTHQAAALGPYTRHKLSALSLAKKLAVLIVLIGVGATAPLGYRFWMRPAPQALRGRIRAHLAAGDYVKARAELAELRHAVGELSQSDRRELAEPVQARLETLAAALHAKIDAERRAEQWEEALHDLEELEKLAVDARWTLFTTAEVLRAAGRDLDAADTYARFALLYPDSNEADDALFWEALAYKSHGELARAKALLEEMLRKYPRSNFLASGRRLLAELTHSPPGP